MPFPLGGILGGLVATRAGHAISTAASTAPVQTFLRSPIIQGGQFGIGYTGGAYLGYGATNTWDPFGLHRPKYKYRKQSFRMAYGMSGYGSYRRRYTRFRRYRRYGRYSRFSRYRRRPMYRRRSYY